MFLAAMVLITAFAVIWMTRPLWRTALHSVQERRAANVAAYRQRLRELQADRAAGLLDGDTLAGLRGELDAGLLEDAGEIAAPLNSAGGRSVALLLLLSLGVIALSLFGYVQSGSWSVQQKVAQASIAQESGEQPDVQQMIASLEKRLEQEPDNIEGWVMFGRSTFMMERYQDSARAYARANELTHFSEPALLVSEGEALALARDQDLLGKPAEMFAAALKIDPEYPRALWYAGLAAEQAGDEARARGYWQALSKQEIPEVLRTVLDERLGQLKSPQVSSLAEPAPPTEFGIDVDVSIAQSLPHDVPANATLFVFAKAQTGPPMPLAVYRGSSSELPLRVRLDDSMAMMPTHKLSQFDAWTLTARISISGQPQASSGDLEGSLTVARSELGGSALHLEISQAVP